ncbi:MAG TPA: hypothetical protein VGU71_00065, partial [Candidatus Dormibacteraeota bacterium]|nr:hypothetical protein [Candidatus Dormibacteraeota bacterium]
HSQEVLTQRILRQLTVCGLVAPLPRPRSELGGGVARVAYGLTRAGYEVARRSDPASDYTATFSGDCDVGGVVTDCGTESCDGDGGLRRGLATFLAAEADEYTRLWRRYGGSE